MRYTCFEMQHAWINNVLVILQLQCTLHCTSRCNNYNLFFSSKSYVAFRNSNNSVILDMIVGYKKIAEVTMHKLTSSSTHARRNWTCFLTSFRLLIFSYNKFDYHHYYGRLHQSYCIKKYGFHMRKKWSNNRTDNATCFASRIVHNITPLFKKYINGKTWIITNNF